MELAHISLGLEAISNHLLLAFVEVLVLFFQLLVHMLQLVILCDQVLRLLLGAELADQVVDFLGCFLVVVAELLDFRFQFFDDLVRAVIHFLMERGRSIAEVLPVLAGDASALL